MKTHTLQKAFILFAFVFMAFALGDGKSEYHIPAAAVSIYCCDIDLDEDNDIIIGHNYSSQTSWGGFSFLYNDSFGYFNFSDSLYTYDNQNIIYALDILGDEIPEIIGRHYDGQQTNLAIVEINNGNYNITYYPMCNHLTSFYPGDVSGNNATDFAFISNNDFLWGIIYNDGTGNFSEPEYFDFDYPPLDIACADLNDDGRDDVVIEGYAIKAFFSTENGFEELLLGYALPLSAFGGATIMLTDFDNDNDKDVLFYATHNSNNGALYMYENLGNNQFYEHDYFYFSPFCSYARTADFNNDSLPDVVFIAQDNSGLFIYKNKGDFQLEFDQFIAVDSLTYRGLNCNDYDKNGYLDISVTTGVGSLNYFLEIFYNDGQGNFQDDPITNIQPRSLGAKSENKNLIKIYPNPFNDKTTISININSDERNKLEIYDIKGKLIRTFINKTLQTGVHKFIWNGKDLNGREVKPGTYFIRLKTGSQIQTEKVVLVR